MSCLVPDFSYYNPLAGWSGTRMWPSLLMIMLPKLAAFKACACACASGAWTIQAADRHRCPLNGTGTPCETAMAGEPKERLTAALRFKWKVGKSASFQPHIGRGEHDPWRGRPGTVLFSRWYRGASCIPSKAAGQTLMLSSGTATNRSPFKQSLLNS